MTTKLTSRLLLVFAASAGTLGLLELAGRLAIDGAPPREDKMVADATLGWVLPAGPTMDWRGTKAAINTLGLRGRQPLSEHGATRILFVGDSSVFGDGVRESQTMSDQLAQRLESRRLVDVQNGGVPGYTCPQSTELIDRLSGRFQPDILVIYSMNSDYRRVAPDDRPMAENRLGLLAGTGLGRLVSAGTLQLRMWRKRPNYEVSAYERCIRSMVVTQQESGGKAVLVIPFREADFPEPSAYPGEEPDPPAARLTTYRAAMARVAAETGSLLVDGPAAVRASGLAKDQALQDIVHPTSRGHAVLAEAIAMALWPEDE
jgi:lysophospholipase L1-like esterase